jgi:hypothetical protein
MEMLEQARRRAERLFARLRLVCADAIAAGDTW